MVGGRWWGCQRLAFKMVSWEDILDQIYEMTKDIQEFPAEAYFDVGSDESVGMSYYCDLDERLEPEDILEEIKTLPVSGLWKEALSAVVKAYCDDIKESEYTLYEED